MQLTVNLNQSKNSVCQVVSLVVSFVENEFNFKDCLHYMTRLLQAISDLQLDVPDAVELLSQFMARAVVDDILPPSFLTKTFQGTVIL